MHFAGKFILDICQFAADRNMASFEDLLAASGCDKNALSKDGAITDYQSVSKLLEVIQKLDGSTNFGLLMGEQISLQATQFVDQLMASCSTVKEAFEYAVAYSRLISDSMQCSLQEDEDAFRVNFELNPDWAVQNEYAIIQNLNVALICAKNALNRLTEKNYFPDEVNLYYAKPKRLSEHFRLFNCRLNFNQPVSSIVFGKYKLNEPNINQNKGLLEQLTRSANALVSSLPDENEKIRVIKKSILQHISPEALQIETIANDQNITVRSLQRMLKSEETSFKTIYTEMRIKLIVKMLNSGYENLDEIAYLIGYSEASALIRAFKKQTGKSPRKYLTATAS